MSDQTSDLMWPQCAGAHHVSSVVCRRCGATEEDECRDDAAYEAQTPKATMTVIDPVPVPNKTSLLNDALGDIHMAYDAGARGDWLTATTYLRLALDQMEDAGVTGE